MVTEAAAPPARTPPRGTWSQGLCSRFSGVDREALHLEILDSPSAFPSTEASGGVSPILDPWPLVLGTVVP